MLIDLGIDLLPFHGMLCEDMRRINVFQIPGDHLKLAGPDTLCYSDRDPVDPVGEFNDRIPSIAGNGHTLKIFHAGEHF